MSVIIKVPEANIFEEICKEFSSFKQLREEDSASVLTDYQDYDPAKHNPVFYGKMHHPINTDADPKTDVDVAAIHPSVIGYAFTDKPEKSPSPPPPPIPAKDQCAPKEYLEHYVFPTLLPALEAMLRQAKKEKCFERKRTKFDALDFLTENLYRDNPNKTKRENVKLEEIQFVKEWLKDHPRPPLPLSLIWTEDEAALIIQSFWRGYLVRREPEVQELRQWQAEYREEHPENIQRRVSDFWEKNMPETQTTSQDKPAQQTDKPAQQTDKSAQQTDKPAQQTDKPEQQTDKPGTS